MSIELHCHSLFSVDGYPTPEDLVDIAADRGVATLSITDHNSLGGAERAARRAAERGIRYLNGIEMDAFFRGRSYHFLGFGFDADHAGLKELAARNYHCYQYRFELFFKELKGLGFPWERDELVHYLEIRYPTHPAPCLSTSMVAPFIKHKGGMDGYGKMKEEAMVRIAPKGRYSNPGPEEDGRFCRFEQVRDTVHEAGGVVLLAHVGNQLPGNHDEQVAMIRAVLDEGVDGFELYHPRHIDNADTERLLALGKELDCLLSGGSDCHRAPCPPPRELGSCGLPEELADRLVEATQSRSLSGRSSG